MCPLIWLGDACESFALSPDTRVGELAAEHRLPAEGAAVRDGDACERLIREHIQLTMDLALTSRVAVQSLDDEVV